MTTFIKIFTADAVMDLEDDQIGVSDRLTRSKDRVRDQAEVFTADREVHAMLDMIEDGPLEPTMSCLEPSCGNGQFLAEILRRKLAWIDGHGDQDPERRAAAAVLALSTTCGIDISLANVRDSQSRLMEIARRYLPSPEWVSLAEAVVSSNIVAGNFLKIGGTDAAAKRPAKDRDLFKPANPDAFSEAIRFIRLGIAKDEGDAFFVLNTGLLGGTEENLGAFWIGSGDHIHPGVNDVATLDEMIRVIAECDECQIFGQPPKERREEERTCLPPFAGIQFSVVAHA